MNAMNRADVCIRGAGIVGMSLALGLDRAGLRVALAGTRPGVAEGAPDLRAFALNLASRRWLERLKVWQALPPLATTAVHDMKVHGDAQGARLGFSAWEQGEEALAWIVDAAALETVLAQAIEFAQGVQRVAMPIEAPLQVIAEGRDASSSTAFGVRTERQPYGHAALAARLRADRPHEGCAWQWFRHPDVLALLPFDPPGPGCGYGLVWSLPQAEVDRLLAADEYAFVAELNAATSGAAGRLDLASARVAWPLSLQQADPISGPGFALVGDAAHRVHPLAGQGLNLGLGDAIALTEVLAGREPWRSPGDERLMQRYARVRRAPTWAMARLTDGLLNLFASQSAPLKELRNRGMTLVDHLPPLKRWLAARAAG